MIELEVSLSASLATFRSEACAQLDTSSLLELQKTKYLATKSKCSFSMIFLRIWLIFSKVRVSLIMSFVSNILQILKAIENQ